MNFCFATELPASSGLWSSDPSTQQKFDLFNKTTWKARNQLISQTTYANGGKFMPGRFAPVFKKVGSSQKLTIVWKDFSPRFKNKIEHHGVVVKPKLGGYSVSCFKNALDWELELIQETENKIKPIRELLAEYHQRKLADIKRLEKLKRLI
ncbi:conjugative transfer protein MobI(A/C) [Escherichia coli]